MREVEWYRDPANFSEAAGEVSSNLFIEGVHPARLADRFHALLLYADCVRTERDILALVAMACFADENTAAKVTDMARIRANRKHTRAEAAYRFLRKGNLERKRRYSCPFRPERLDMEQGLAIGRRGEIHLQDRYFPDFVNPEYRDRLYALNIPGHRVFACRRHSGRLALIYVTGCEQAVLVDEEEFTGSEPTYFTESTHFRSPVNVLHTLREIFRYVLARDFNPPIQLELNLAVPSAKCSFLNIDDFIKDDIRETHPDWRELNLIMRSERPSGYLVNDVAPFFDKPDGDWYGYDCRIRELLALTSEIFAMIPPDKFYTRLTPEVLEAATSLLWLPPES